MVCVSRPLIFLLVNSHYWIAGIIETIAESMASTLALLAANEDQQDKAYNIIQEVLPDGRDMVCLAPLCKSDPARSLRHLQTYDDVPALDKILACFLEGVRMFRESPTSLSYTSFR